MKKQIFTPVLFLLFVQIIMAQVPNITYSGVQVYYATGSAITTLSPTNTGGVSTGDKLMILKTDYESPRDIAVDSIGNIFVVNEKSGVTKLDSNGRIVKTFGLQNSSSVTIDKKGNIYVISNYNDLYKYDTSGNLIKIFTKTKINGEEVNFSKVAIDNSGNIIWKVMKDPNSLIMKMDSTGLNVQTLFSIRNTSGDAPLLDSKCNIYFLVTPTYTPSYIMKINSTGINSSTFINYNVLYTAIDNVSKFYGYLNGNTFTKWDENGNIIGTVQADFDYNAPIKIAFDKYNYLYVTEYRKNSIKKISFTKPFTIQPALPTGLNFDTNSGAISGIPSVTTPTTTYTITACNTLGQSTTTVSFATIAKPEISYTGVLSNYALNTAVTSLTPTNLGSPIIGNYSIQPTLPAGLSLNASTGIISGTPTEAKSSTIYTITASNQAGLGSTTITFSTSTVKPILIYNGIQSIYPLNFPITALTPTNTGSPVIGTYMIIPSLPSGLSLDVQTGIISGTPSVVTSSTDYSVIAGNSAGTSSTKITFETIAKPNITYNGIQSTYILNTSITPLTPTNTGGLVNGSYFILPDLPTGLNFDVTTGIITGTPSVASISTTYTIVAGNVAGQSSTTITFATLKPNAITEIQNTLISTFPNPVKNILHIESNETILYLDFLNLTGSKLIYCKPNNFSAQLNISIYPKGTYILKVGTINKLQIVKIINE